MVGGVFFSGLSYIWLFLKQYGFAGILIAVPIAAVGRMNRKMRLPLFITAVYFIYILMVGGCSSRAPVFYGSASIIVSDVFCGY